MTTLEVEIISRECIRPSSATPPHLKAYKICFLDQFSAHDYTPLALYYPSPNPMNPEHTNHHNLHILKQSLSETLTLFYPFAGKVKDSLSIDCNDEGVHFTVAQVKNNISLNAFLTNPCLSMNNKFLPDDEASIETITTRASHLLMTQVTRFPCGGMVIGLRLSHKIIDGKGMCTFLKTWSAIAKNSQGQEGVVVCPDFDIASSLFPQTDSFPSEATIMSLIIPFLRKGRLGVTRVVFDAPSLARLKVNVKKANPLVLNPTSVEVVTALLFKCILRVIKAKSATSFKPISLAHPVNLRPRAMPPLPENSMGNILAYAALLCTDEEPDLDDLISKWREVMARFDDDFVKSLQGDGGSVKFCEAINDVRRLKSNAAEHVGFNSWRRFGLYDIDFGWGKPIWLSNHRSNEEGDVFLYLNTLMDTRSGDGIEAWVYVEEQDIHILEHDNELLAFAKVNPSPLLQL